ncbi:MAG: HAMP domain-containing histidine kinase [Ruminococcus sp.]|nr:HAMP domain-containing histidine kinase [Ruminococcus sp.]
MNEHAIKKLRRKFITISFISLFSVMLIMGSMIYYVNYITSVRQMDNALNYLVEKGGEVDFDTPIRHWDGASYDSANSSADNFTEIFMETLRELFNTKINEGSESIFGMRYFAVVFQDEGDTNPITAHINEIDEDSAFAYADEALKEGHEYGWMGNYRYKVYKSDGQTVVVFLNVANQIADQRRIGSTVLILSIFGSALSYLIIRIFSNRAIRPEIRNAENQKRFITNASHELKTPLAVIRANTELEMMMHGEDEWNESTMNQVDRMTGLISNLVLIAKADEKANKEGRSDIDVSDAVTKAAEAFAPVAKQNGKTLTMDIPGEIHMVASESQIQQLVTLFVDNAIKYCDDGGEIKVTLHQKGKGVKIAVSNNYAEGKDVDYTRFLDRFYREDQSHNIDKGGFGIGLSIADSIVRQYRGKLDVSYQDGVIEFSAVLKP